jgi:hypothetical protein
MTKDESIVWRQEWLKNNSLGHDDVLEEMKHRLSDIPTGDFRGKLCYYPDYYLKEKKSRDGSDNDDDGGAGSASAPRSSTVDKSSGPQAKKSDVEGNSKSHGESSHSSASSSNGLPLRTHPDAAAAPKSASKRRLSPRRTSSQPPAKRRCPSSRSKSDTASA